MIELNKNFKIDTSGEGVTLVFQEKRLKPEIVDKIKTGNQVEYIHKQEYFLLNIKQALNYFLQLEVKEVQEVEDIMKKMLETENIIKNLKLEC